MPSIVVSVGEQASFGAFVRRCREARHLSARSLSLQAGLSESMVTKIERGNIEPGLRVFAKLAAALNLNDREIAFLVRLMQTNGHGEAHHAAKAPPTPHSPAARP
jgi:transcriptional regulator with XRE-family HTH domain